jgi:phage replication-related protein YjqB (UPF0714/DUF867 family)
VTNRDRYESFAELAMHEREGTDYRITIVRRPSAIAIIAPHGDAIETRTAAVARAIAGDDFNVYLFEGIKPAGNYTALHITSHRFDEPSCLSLIRDCRIVVAIHGFDAADERVLLGGLDRALKLRIAESLRQAGVCAETDGHPFCGTDPNNICNRGQSGRGVQLEISGPLRKGGNELTLAQTVRGALLALQMSHREYG